MRKIQSPLVLSLSKDRFEPFGWLLAAAAQDKLGPDGPSREPSYPATQSAFGMPSRLSTALRSPRSTHPSAASRATGFAR